MRRKINPNKFQNSFAGRKRKRSIDERNYGGFWNKTMQTLTAGSFLNLENDSTIEALKHTAHRLAEHTATVVKENLQPTALENLANTLWGKAEYVTRETERRRLHQIFVESFSERFRELKPQAAQSQNSSSEFSTADAPVETAASKEESNAPAIAQSEGRESAEAAARENISSTASPEESAPEAEEEKTDEFLGFVESDESFKDMQAKDANATATAREENAPTTVQNADELSTETSKAENQLVTTETPVSANQAAAKNVESQAVNTSNAVDTSNHAKPEATTITAPESKPPTAAATVNTAKASANVADGKEPFEFEKCTINLNLTLLPAESGKNARKVIIGATSHNLPPEIDFLEITDGGNLSQIAGLIREKLERFKQTLPVKYIEQLRQSKNKAAKKSAPVKATIAAATAAPTQTAINQMKSEMPSGKQETQEASSNETVKPQPETTAESSIAASTVAPPTVNQSVAANSIQGSLF